MIKLLIAAILILVVLGTWFKLGSKLGNDDWD
jgi:hypothetical protein